MGQAWRWSCRTVWIVLVLAICVSGCGKQELSQMAIVMAVGLDKDKTTGKIQITAQIVRPADARGSTGAPSGGTGNPVWTVNAEGSTIFEAIRNLARFSSRRVFWAHNKVIVVGEELARDDITDLLDFFTRNHELRMNTWIVTTLGKASELVATKTGMEVVPGDSIDRLFRFSPIVSEAPRSTIKEVTASYLSRTSNPVMALVNNRKRMLQERDKREFGGKDQVELSGTAVYRKGKMIGTLSPSESRGMLWFIEKVESGVVPLKCPDYPDKPVSLEIKRGDFEVTPHYSGDDEVSFRVQLKLQMDLVELGCPTRLSTAEVVNLLEEEASEKVEEEIQAMLHKAQKVLKTDFLDLGKTFENRYPDKWRSLRGRWDELFQKAEFTLEVQTEINSPVLLIVPTRPMGEP